MEKKPLTIDELDTICDQIIKFANKCNEAKEYVLLHEVNKLKEILNIKRCEL